MSHKIDLNHAVQFQHLFWQDVLPSAKVIVDATCGNGHDLEYILRHKQSGARVWAIDIQECALSETKARLAETVGIEHVTFLSKSHDQAIESLPDQSIDLLIFNLGYLPKGNHALHTKPETTVAALLTAFEKLAPRGVMTVVTYPGTDMGFAEQTAVEHFLIQVPQQKYDVSRWNPINQKNNPPQLYLIRGR